MLKNKTKQQKQKQKWSGFDFSNFKPPKNDGIQGVKMLRKNKKIVLDIF